MTVNAKSTLTTMPRQMRIRCLCDCCRVVGVGLAAARSSALEENAAGKTSRAISQTALHPSRASAAESAPRRSWPAPETPLRVRAVHPGRTPRGRKGILARPRHGARGIWRSTVCLRRRPAALEESGPDSPPRDASTVSPDASPSRSGAHPAPTQSGGHHFRLDYFADPILRRNCSAVLGCSYASNACLTAASTICFFFASVTVSK